MIIEPRMRGFICTTSHPTGCSQNVKNQIEYIKSKAAINGAKSLGD
jgi:enoyl-[acyl-carrier protein] reductase/trans-2-enoyl-CoA reductase (NAD+)